MVEATIDSMIRLEKAGLSEKIIGEIKASLMMTNPVRANAQKEQIGGWWNIEEFIQLWSEEEDKLILPRGYLSQLKKGFDFYGIAARFTDNMVRVDTDIFEQTIPVPCRDYQLAAIERILALHQGVWESPPGSGKTVSILEAIRRGNQNSLVIVDKTNIAEQWRDRASTFLGRSVGLVGDKKWDIDGITIALQQTLWSRREELLEAGFFDQWGFVCLDECHHLPANTFTEILSLFPAKYRIGVSGTPYKQPGMEDLIWATLGPKIHETKKEQLIRDGWLIKPKVKIWQTNFKANFWPTHQGDTKKEKCNYFYCTRPKNKKRHQNNYQEIMKELVEDDERNRFIARNVALDLDEGHTVIVLSKRLAHLGVLHDLVANYSSLGERLWQFTGKQSTKERLAIQQAAEEGSCVLFSTIADEALDIPRISRIHLAWPTRNTGTIEQQIGRGERPHPDKKDVIINDYWDKVGPLTGQLRDRVNLVYIPQMLAITGGEDLYEDLSDN